MKTKTFFQIFLLSFLGIAVRANAQITISYAMDSPGFMILYKDISKFKTLDNSYINVTYKMEFKSNPSNPEDISEDEMYLQIGKLYSKFFSLAAHQTDSISTADMSKIGLSGSMPTNDDGCQGYEIFTNLKTKNLTVTNRVPYSSVVYKYTETAPTVKWEMHPETEYILNHKCQKATTNLFGRNYTAWYAIDIPTKANLWKFNGLPGLIMKIYDENNEYSWECTGINQYPERIVMYDWTYKNVSKDKWNDFESAMYKNAGQFLKNSGQRVLIMDNSAKGYHPVPQDWEASYNPIEKK